LQDEETREVYLERTDELTKEREETTGREWEGVAKIMTEAALEVCGTKKKNMATPWMAGREKRLLEMRGKISGTVQLVREKKERFKQDSTEEARREVEEAIEARKRARRARRGVIKEWEREYWDRIIANMQEAQERGNYGEMYRTLRALGQRGESRALPSSVFSPEMDGWTQEDG